MENKKDMIAELKNMWRSLYREVVGDKKFKFDSFESAFSQTYGLLVEHSAEDSLDKQYIQLIAEAYLFASINDSLLESEFRAASVLTERMLSSLAFNSTSDTTVSSKIYILEAHEEIELNFEDIDESISKLVKVYEGIQPY